MTTDANAPVETDDVLDTSARKPRHHDPGPTAREEFLSVLAGALDRHAGDIYLTPEGESGTVSARDGQGSPLPTTYRVDFDRYVEFLKVLADAAGITPQQWYDDTPSRRVVVTHNDKRIECKVAFIPTASGVAAVIGMHGK